MSAVDMIEMTLEEAHEFVAYIRNQQHELPRRIQDAWRRRAWVPLGYPSWDAMCVGERIQLRGLPQDERQEVVVELRSAGMSTRAIGSALGVGKDTVHRDLATVSDETDDQPTTVTSLDGRQRPATRPAPAGPVPSFSWPAEPEPEPDDAPAADPLPAPIAEEIAERVAIKQSVAEALDRYAPDPEAPVRQWRIAFLAALRAAYKVPAQFAVDQAADQVDDLCLEELRRAAENLTDYYERVKAARPTPDNVRHLRAV